MTSNAQVRQERLRNLLETFEVNQIGIPPSTMRVTQKDQRLMAMLAAFANKHNVALAQVKADFMQLRLLNECGKLETLRGTNQ